MDRTTEFNSILSRNPSHQAGRSTAPPEDTDGSMRSGFNNEAARIGQEIHVAQLKLDELGKLARQKSIFNDSSSRISQLTESIAHDISTLTGKVDQFSMVARTTGNPSMRQYAESLVSTLRQRLTEIVRGLQEVSELRMRILQEQENRRNKFSFAPSIASAAAGYAPVNTEDPELGESAGTASSMVRENYHTSRLSSVQGIQRTIAELGQMFSKMATTIQQQEEMVSRIDSDIDAADMNIKEGTNQLMIYYNSMSSNRKLIIKIFLILIGFAIIMALTS